MQKQSVHLGIEFLFYYATDKEGKCLHDNVEIENRRELFAKMIFFESFQFVA